jgi:GMP synthase (glutamine-hydrolysing)
LDFGSQYTHIIARRIRELHVYCELYSCLVTLEELQQHSTNIIAIVLSGGPSSVYEADAPHVHDDIWDYIQQRQIPVLGICYGMQELAFHFPGGAVQKGNTHEYGKSTVVRDRSSNQSSDEASLLFQDIPEDEMIMWMSHGDQIQHIPEGFHRTAYTDNVDCVAMENSTTHMYGIQFHPEVTHSGPYGKQILHNFCIHIAKAQPNWIMMNYAQEFIASVQQMVGPTGHVLGAVSGGVDSTVAAVLMTRAIGSRFHAVLVDNGCLRKDEAQKVLQRMTQICNVDLRCVDASELFMEKLKGVTDPELKRKIIGTTFIDVFQNEVNLMKEKENIVCDYLLQGTLYPDVIESMSYKGPSACIKTHHNVGGLPDTMHLQLIEPLRELFKDEVRELGLALGIDEISVWRHPFPGPGLAIRILGDVTRERVAVLQQADSIMIDILERTGHYKLIGQAFVVLLPTVQSVGVMGDGRTYENVAVIRCVETTDYMTADFYHLPYEIMSEMSSRIINEVRGINRVCYDISSKPPATIEWE